MAWQIAIVLVLLACVFCLFLLANSFTSNLQPLKIFFILIAFLVLIASLFVASQITELGDESTTLINNSLVITGGLNLTSLGGNGTHHVCVDGNGTFFVCGV